jgi:hypothetical protein
MKQSLRLLAALGALALGFSASAQPVETSAPKTYSAAIVVTNRAGPELDEKVPVIEDLISARVADLGLNLISQDVVTGSAGGRDASGLDAQLADSTSALRLAQNLGADYILVASINGFSEQKKNIKAYGTNLANYTYTLRLSYKLVDAQSGGTVTGGTAKAVRTEQNSIHANSGFVMVAPDPSTPPAAASADGTNADDALARAARRYEKAIGVVIVGLPSGPQPFASAWGVGPRAFATNSHVTEGAKEYMAKGLPVYVVINKNPDLRYTVTRAISHPKYGGPGPNSDGRPPAVGGYDVGILEVDGTLAAWMPVAPSDELRKIDSGYRIAYLGFPMEEVQGGGVDPRSPVATMQSGIVTANTDWWLSGSNPEDRLLVQHNLSSSGGASGSPVFNTKGQVVALHSAGNSNTSIVVEGDKITKTRRKSGVQINYAQRADLLNDIYKPSASLPSVSAGAATSGSAPASASVAFLDPDVSSFIDDLIEEATLQITDSLRARIAQNRIPAPAKAKAAGLATLTVNVETADLYIPDIRVGPQNTVTVQDGALRVAPLNVVVEVDGITVGSAPGKIQVRPGFSRLRLTRTGYETWERTINAVDGQTLNVAMQMDAEGIRRWKELTAFTNNLQNGAKLSDAEIDVLKAKAQMLSQSGYKVDIKVDTDEPVTIDNSQSLFSK